MKVFMKLTLALALSFFYVHAAMAAPTITVVSSAPVPDALVAERIFMPSHASRDQMYGWVIKLDSSSATSTLKGAVNWGDEKDKTDATKLEALPVPLYLGSYVVFLHTYEATGKYSQSFSLKDAAGRKLRVLSNTTVVR